MVRRNVSNTSTYGYTVVDLCASRAMTYAILHTMGVVLHGKLFGDTSSRVTLMQDSQMRCVYVVIVFTVFFGYIA